MKMLVVDDDRGFLNAVTLMLSDGGHDVAGTTDVDEAVSKVASEGYDFVLVDYKMPGKDGIWFMRNVDLPKQTKVILVTAYVNREVIKTMFDLGASGYLIKPFGQDDLLRHIEYLATPSSN